MSVCSIIIDKTLDWFITKFIWFGKFLIMRKFWFSGQARLPRWFKVAKLGCQGGLKLGCQGGLKLGCQGGLKSNIDKKYKTVDWTG